MKKGVETEYARQGTLRLPDNHHKQERGKKRFSNRAFSERMALLTP